MNKELSENPFLNKFEYTTDKFVDCHIGFEKELQSVVQTNKKLSLLVDLENTLDLLVKNKEKNITIQPRKFELLKNTDGICSIHHFKNPQLRILYYYHSEDKIPILLVAFCEKEIKTYRRAISVAKNRKKNILSSF